MPPGKKRKTLHDYFIPVNNIEDEEHRASISPAQAPANTVPIHGLTIIEDFVTLDEQATLLEFLDAQPWRTDLSRRTIHYGGTYCVLPPPNASVGERKLIESTIITAPAIPGKLTWLIERMISQGLYSDSARPTYCIVNEYLPPHGISAHVENFRFGEPVCSLTLGRGDYMRFHELRFPDDGSVRSFKAAKAPRTGRKVDVWLPPGSLVVLREKARYEWQHEILRGRKGRVGKDWRRVSLTFRVDKTLQSAESSVKSIS